MLVVCYLKDVVSDLQLRSLATGGLTQPIPMPGIGSVASFSGRRRDSEFFFLFTSFTEPGAIYRWVHRATPARCVHLHQVLSVVALPVCWLSAHLGFNLLKCPMLAVVLPQGGCHSSTPGATLVPPHRAEAQVQPG